MGNNTNEEFELNATENSDVILKQMAICDYYNSIKKYLSGTNIDNLFKENVRGFMSDKSKPNKEIKDTLESDKKRLNFAILNNGVTIICDDVIKDKEGLLKLKNIRIINGLQTTKTIWNYFESEGNLEEFKDAYICVKIINSKVIGESLTEDEIVVASNKNNPITDFDLIANDKIMGNLENSVDKAIFGSKHLKLVYKRVGKKTLTTTMDPPEISIRDFIKTVYAFTNPLLPSGARTGINDFAKKTSIKYKNTFIPLMKIYDGDGEWTTDWKIYLGRRTFTEENVAKFAQIFLLFKKYLSTTDRMENVDNEYCKEIAGISKNYKRSLFIMHCISIASLLHWKKINSIDVNTFESELNIDWFIKKIIILLDEFVLMKAFRMKETDLVNFASKSTPWKEWISDDNYSFITDNGGTLYEES